MEDYLIKRLDGKLDHWQVVREGKKLPKKIRYSPKDAEELLGQISKAYGKDEDFKPGKFRSVDLEPDESVDPGEFEIDE